MTLELLGVGKVGAATAVPADGGDDRANPLGAPFAVVVQCVSRVTCAAGEPADGVAHSARLCAAFGEARSFAAGGDEHQAAPVLRRAEIGGIQDAAVVLQAAGRDAVGELLEQVVAPEPGNVLHQHEPGPDLANQSQEVEHEAVALVVYGVPAAGPNRREALARRAPGEQVQLACTQAGGAEQPGRRAGVAYVAKDDRNAREVHAVALDGERQDVNRGGHAEAGLPQSQAQPSRAAEHIDGRRPAPARSRRVPQPHIRLRMIRRRLPPLSAAASIAQAEMGAGFRIA